MKLTAHSETGHLDTLYIKRAAYAYITEERMSRDWKPLNYLEKPQWNAALQEYGQFEAILKKYVENIYYLPEDEQVNMDSIYCRDASIATNKGVIICNMGKAGRKSEPASQRRVFEKNGIQVLGEIKAPATVEGGDVAWLDEHTLAVGYTYRTNEAGIRQLQDLLKIANVDLLRVPLPHYKGPSDVFHLMSILSPVDNNLAVVYSPLMPIEFRENLIARGYELVEVPESEFESMGCNVLALSPRVCLMVSGNPVTKSLLESAGCRVIEYEGAEISVKGGGGPTCLTRPILRKINQ